MDYLEKIKSMVTEQPKSCSGVHPAKKLACDLCKNPNINLDAKAVVQTFMQYRMLREATGFLLCYLEGDCKEHSALQTLVLEINLVGGAHQVADAILDRDMFHHFDKCHIAQLCERTGLFERAFEIYKDCGENERAVGVLLDKIKDIGRAERFAKLVQNSEVTKQVIAARLQQELGSGFSATTHTMPRTYHASHTTQLSAGAATCC